MATDTGMLTQERLKAGFEYNPITGIFTRVQCRFPSKVGKPAGSLNKAIGYLYIRIDGKFYLAHRLAFLYMMGAFPSSEVDHLNCVRTDNRWSNLRVVSRAANSQNRRTSSRRNKCGFLGVVQIGRKFQAAIKIGDKQVKLGNFDTPEEAHQRYVIAKRQHHAGCTL